LGAILCSETKNVSLSFVEAPEILGRERREAMTDKMFFVERPPERRREIGRVNNEINPRTNREGIPIRHEIGRIFNEINPEPEPSPLPEEIGRVNNELDPSAVPVQQEIGRLNNERTG
jgi:hypothetical protein